MLFEVNGRTINGDDIQEVGKTYTDMSSNWHYIIMSFIIKMKNGEEIRVVGNNEHSNWRNANGFRNANDGGAGFVAYQKTEQYKKEIGALEERRNLVLKYWNGSGEVVCI